MNLKALAVLATFSVLSAFARAAEPDVVVADFEGADYAGWTATGTAFGTGPAKGTLKSQQAIAGFQGKGLVNTYLGGDGAQGTLTSPEFPVDRDFIAFLIGGGAHDGKTCVNLLVDGKPVRTATGDDDERLHWFTWDVKDLKGKTARIQIVDAATGGWGHVNVDQIVRTDSPPVPPASATPLYQEAYRPQFHFTSAKNWINDPNGMVYYAGEYHLFFQHNPLGRAWGNMTWGHAVSRDMVRWTQLPDKLHPDAMGTMFSGSAVVDVDNTGGFQTGAEKPLVAMYTAAGNTSPESKGKPFVQCLAFSNDRGRTWTKYDKNPVLAHVAAENRDPKVIWHAGSKRWVMALYLDKSKFALYASPDLKKWEHLQDVELPEDSECPDFFPLALDGDPAKQRWVFSGANGRYLVGTFDGKRFETDGKSRRIEYGRNYYAAQTFSDVPAADGRRIQIAWLRNGRFPRMPFNGQMSFPSELKLRTTPDGPTLFRTPVAEIESLYDATHKWADVALKPGDNPLASLSGDLFDIAAEFDVGDAAEVGFKIRGETVAYHAKDEVLDALGKAPLKPIDGRITLRVLVDRTTIETFGNDGRVALASCFVPPPTGRSLAVYAKGGTARIKSLTVRTLKSAWPAAAEK